MPLHLIHGPPNTGRTDLLEGAFNKQIEREPFLVVPGSDDIFDWERRLTRETGALVGGRVMHFRDLCREILIQAGKPVADDASELQRRHFLRKALHREWPKLAGRLENQPGLAASVLDLIDEFRGEMIDPATLEDRVTGSKLGSLGPLVKVYSAYLDLLADGEKLSDGPRDAERAVRAVSGCWGSRPLFVAGFDDMTPLQLELIRKVAVDVGAEVTVAVAHEHGSPALDWTNQLVASLKEDARATELSETPTTRESASKDHDPALLDVERRFMKPADGERPIPASDAVTVLRSSGPRNEAEAIGAEIARLIKDGAGPGDIAVAVGSPATDGPLIGDVLARYSIPATLESETAARDTTAGQTILSVLSAIAPGAGAEPLLAWMRSPLGPDREVVDGIEFEVLTEGLSSARQVVEGLLPEPPDGWTEFTDAIGGGDSVNETVARLALEIVTRLLALDRQLPPSPRTVVEAQMASAIAAAANELLAIQDSRSDGIAEIRSAIETDAITVWSVPAAGTVRIASPYSLRAKRFKHLFMASQQEGGIRDLDRSGPFLSNSDRDGLKMSKRRDPEVQERYLFYSCLTVPTDGLWISCQTSDEAGKAEQPSPLVGSVEELFEPDPDGDPAVRRGGRAGSDIVFDLGDSPSLVEATRSIASSGGDPEALLEDPGQADLVGVRLGAARALETGTRKLGDIRLASILAELGRDPRFGATEIEAYAGCPYRWFVERQLRPTDFGPEPDYLAMGSLVHSVLEDLFALYVSEDGAEDEPLSDIWDGGSPRQWLGQVPKLVEKHAREFGLGGSGPASRGNRRRATALVSKYLEQEAARFRNGPAPRHRVAMLELEFGTGEAPDTVVDMGRWGLKGKIDRVDLGPDAGQGRREAVAVDYKTGDVSGLGRASAEKSRKIQLQLYMHALRSTGYEPAASLYVPIRQGPEKSRGAYPNALKAEMVKRGASNKDGVDELGDFIDRGVELSDQAVGNMLDGRIEHDAATCPDHFSHAAVPDSSDEGDEA